MFKGGVIGRVLVERKVFILLRYFLFFMNPTKNTSNSVFKSVFKRVFNSVSFRIFSSVYQAIRQNKMLVIGIILLQTILLVTLFGAILHYQVKIITNAQNIIQPIQAANYDVGQLQGGQPFIQDIFAVHQSYLALKKNVLLLGGILLTLYLLFQGALWVATQHLLHHATWKQAGKMWLKFAVSSTVLFVPYFAASFFIIKSLITQGADMASFSTVAQNLAIAFGVWYYFSLVAFALMHYASWKIFVKRWFDLAISRLYQTIFVVAIIAAVIGALLYVNYLAIMQTDSLGLMVGAVLLLMIAFVCCRIFWIAALHALSVQEELVQGASVQRESVPGRSGQGQSGAHSHNPHNPHNNNTADYNTNSSHHEKN